MKFRSTFLSLTTFGFVCFSGQILAAPITSKIITLMGLSAVMTSNAPFADAVRGQNSLTSKTHLRQLMNKKSKCSEEQEHHICEDFCTNSVPKGTQLKSCTDSEAVNTYTCTFEGTSSSSACYSCPTDDETGLWFERKSIDRGTPCLVTCEYSNPEREEESECADLCVKRYRPTGLSLTDCSLDENEDGDKFLECEYEGVKKGSCSNCPTDSEVGNGFWFKSKTTTTDGDFCKSTCRYINDED